MRLRKNEANIRNEGLVAKIYNVFRWSFLFVVIVISIYAIYNAFQLANL